MTAQPLNGMTALVTGASSGLGVDFARELAARGANLVLTARRRDLLEARAGELESTYGITVRCIDGDLTQSEVREGLARALEADGIAVDILINNAGFGLFGDFRDTPWARTDSMLQLDVVALTHLSRLFVNPMVARGRGHIMLIASTGAFQPSPSYAAYAAAKAFVLSFGHALHDELRSTGVTCTTVCPGVTATEFLQVSGQRKNWFHKATMMPSATVARMAVNRMLAGRPEIVTGRINALNAFVMRFMPRPLMARLAYYVMKN
jgi:uncharacterized protein